MELSKNPIIKPDIVKIHVKGKKMWFEIEAENQDVFKNLDMEIKLESVEDIQGFFRSIMEALEYGRK